MHLEQQLQPVQCTTYIVRVRRTPTLANIITYTYATHNTIAYPVKHNLVNCRW